MAKARTNSMGDLRAVFGDVMMRALATILSDSQDMFEVQREPRCLYAHHEQRSASPRVSSL